MEAACMLGLQSGPAVSTKRPEGGREPRGRRTVCMRPGKVCQQQPRALVQPKSVNLPRLLFRCEVCSEVGSDSTQLSVLSVRPAELEHRERGDWLPGSTWAGRQVSGSGTIHTTAMNGCFSAPELLQGQVRVRQAGCAGWVPEGGPHPSSQSGRAPASTLGEQAPD